MIILKFVFKKEGYVRTGFLWRWTRDAAGFVNMVINLRFPNAAEFLD
jgi:hypothetical protein